MGSAHSSISGEKQQTLLDTSRRNETFNAKKNVVYKGSEGAVDDVWG